MQIIFQPLYLLKKLNTSSFIERKQTMWLHFRMRVTGSGQKPAIIKPLKCKSIRRGSTTPQTAEWVLEAKDFSSEKQRHL